MANSSDLNSRPASAFLNADAFRTGYDVDLVRSQNRYRDELSKCADYVDFHIGINGVWSATTKGGADVSSYERIGYHAYSADLLQAALDSDCAFIVHRVENGTIVDYDLRELQADAAGGRASWDLVEV